MEYTESYTVIEETKVVRVAMHVVMAVLMYNIGLTGATKEKVNNFLTWAITTGRMEKDGWIMVKNLTGYINEYAELYSKLK